MDGCEPSSGEVFDVETIRRLVELMREHDLGEIDLRQGDQRIRLARGVAAFAQPAIALSSAPAPAASPGASPRPVGVEGPPPPEPENVVYIKSPMVGTFYVRANPNVEPYVRVGDSVEADTTVCVIEAMKVFNEIPAEVRGRIAAILVEDEESVEFGKPLFKIETSG